MPLRNATAEEIRELDTAYCEWSGVEQYDEPQAELTMIQDFHSGGPGYVGEVGHLFFDGWPGAVVSFYKPFGKWWKLAASSEERFGDDL